MSDSINIRRRRSVTFRTDCFATGYDTDYFVRETTGYEPIITDISDGIDVYDVGHNPLVRHTDNPLVCDQLLLDYHNTDEAQAITDLPYKDLLFTKPLIAIPNSALASTADRSHIILATDEYYKIDRLYVDPTTNPYTSHIEGVHHTGGQNVTYNGAFEQLVTPSVPVDTTELRISYHPQRVWQGDTNFRVLNSLQMRSMLAGTPAAYSIWNAISGYTYGAMVITGDNSANDHHIAMWRYRTKRISDGAMVGIIVRVDMDGFLNYILPFASGTEYNAARCTVEKWRTADVQAIQDWLNNR